MPVRRQLSDDQNICVACGGQLPVSNPRLGHCAGCGGALGDDVDTCDSPTLPDAAAAEQQPRGGGVASCVQAWVDDQNRVSKNDKKRQKKLSKHKVAAALVSRTQHLGKTDARCSPAVADAAGATSANTGSQPPGLKRDALASTDPGLVSVLDAPAPVPMATEESLMIQAEMLRAFPPHTDSAVLVPLQPGHGRWARRKVKANRGSNSVAGAGAEAEAVGTAAASRQAYIDRVLSTLFFVMILFICCLSPQAAAF